MSDAAAHSPPATTWEGVAVREITFDLPFRLPSKKNDVALRPLPGGGHMKVAGSATQAAEHAIQAIALARIGVLFNLITAQEEWTICRLARQRVAKDSGVGQKTLEKRIGTLRRLVAALFADHDVSIEIEERISPKAGGDVARVTVRDLGEPIRRKRSGRQHDLCNIAAVVTDALQGVVYDDDCQIVRELTHRTFPAEKTMFEPETLSPSP